MFINRREMTRSDLIRRLAQCSPHLTEADAARIVATVFEGIARHLVDGGRVELRGFGAFTTRRRAAGVGNNPRTNERVELKRTRSIHFRPGKKAREMVNIRYARVTDPSSKP